MDIDIEKTKAQHEERQSTASFRREEFSLDEAKDSAVIAELKKTVSRESERRASHPELYAETVPEAAIEATPALTTPAVEAKDYMAAGELQQTHNDNNDKSDEEVHEAGSKLREMTLPGDNPDKPVSAAQEEAGPMQPSDPKDTATISPSPEPTAVTPTKPAAAETQPSQSTTTTPARARRGSVAVPNPISVSPEATQGAAQPPQEASLPEDSAPRTPSIAAPEEENKPVETTAATTPAAAPAAPSPAVPSSAASSNTHSARPKTPISVKKSTGSPTSSKPARSVKSSGHSPKAPLRKPSGTSVSSSTASPHTKTAAAAGTKQPAR